MLAVGGAGAGAGDENPGDGNRRLFPKEAKNILNETFLKNRNPSKEEIKELAKKVGCEKDPKRVSRWFRNQRNRRKEDVQTGEETDEDIVSVDDEEEQVPLVDGQTGEEIDEDVASVDDEQHQAVSLENIQTGEDTHQDVSVGDQQQGTLIIIPNVEQPPSRRLMMPGYEIADFEFCMSKHGGVISDSESHEHEAAENEFTAEDFKFADSMIQEYNVDAVDKPKDIDAL